MEVQPLKSMAVRSDGLSPGSGSSGMLSYEGKPAVGGILLFGTMLPRFSQGESFCGLHSCFNHTETSRAPTFCAENDHNRCLPLGLRGL